MVAVALAGLLAADAVAAPRRVIILRHGEKADAFRLTPVGLRRAQALAAQYLGRGAAPSLFGPNERPAAFLTMTAHTMELMAPTTMSWDLPATSWLALSGEEGADPEVEMNSRTRQAARALLRNPAWRNRTVVVCWEHHHIADDALEAKYPGERVTWRQLLRLDRLPARYRDQVPLRWDGTNFDYFWIVDFDAAGRPKSFEARLQDFVPPFDDVPRNLWGTPE